jgi:hypothetical protein
MSQCFHMRNWYNNISFFLELNESCDSQCFIIGNDFVDPYKNSLPNEWNFNAEREYLACEPGNEIALNPNLTQNPGW